MKIEFLLIKQENSKCNSLKTMKSLLASDSSITIDSKTVKVGLHTCGYSLTTDLVEDEKNERYFSFVMESALEKEEESVDSLIAIFRTVKSILLESGNNFRVAILWDDTAFYFSRKSYPLIFEIENTMRKLIYKFMLTKLGTDWYKNAVPDEFKTSVSDTNKRREKANDFFESVLYNADFIHIVSFLFRPYNVNPEAVINRIKNATSLEDIDLNSLKNLVPQDNWSRFFAPLIKHEGFKKQWESLYELRCKVAHNTLIDRGDYNEIVKLTSELRGKLETAIASLEQIKMNEEDRQDLSKSALQSLLDSISENEKYQGIFKIWSDDNSSMFSRPLRESFDDIINRNIRFHELDDWNASNIHLYLSGKERRKCVQCGKPIKIDSSSEGAHKFCEKCRGSDGDDLAMA